MKTLHLQCHGVFSVSSLVVGLAMAPLASASAQSETSMREDRASSTATAANLGPANSGEIVVTAQKRAESINDVGISITAASGAQLSARGIVDTSQLAKIVPGFNYNSTSYGSPVYTIRGIGFQDSSLAASPAVSVYVDEVPLPYPTETLGAPLDIERVEVLKGPQGTLYGENSTGGAINYVAARPTDHLTLGADASYGRFNTVDLSGFVSGPITELLDFRVSGRSLQGDAWQQSYTRNDSIGSINELFGRLLLDWHPTDRLKFKINLNGWRDHSQSQAQQAIAILSQTTAADLYPQLAASPLAPANARAADWDPGVSYRHNNYFLQGSIRGDYSLTNDTVLSSITAYENFHRYSPVDGDGTQYQSIYFINSGHVATIFQELRLSGILGAKGHWLLGGNYQSDKTHDYSLLDINQSAVRYLGTVLNENQQNVESEAAYANGDYLIFPKLTLTAGVRYTKTDRTYTGCTRDSGDGKLAAILA